jgi:hypothetical protein
MYDDKLIAVYAFAFGLLGALFGTVLFEVYAAHAQVSDLPALVPEGLIEVNSTEISKIGIIDAFDAASSTLPQVDRARFDREERNFKVLLEQQKITNQYLKLMLEKI